MTEIVQAHPLATVTALLLLGVGSAVGAALLLSRANRGERLPLLSARGVRMPLPVYVCHVAALAALFPAAAITSDSGPLVVRPSMVVVLLLLGIEVLGRVVHNRRLQDDDSGGRPTGVVPPPMAGRG